MKKSATQQHRQRLTIDQTDELIRNAAAKTDGAIEDLEESRNTVSYFFESGAVGIVDRSTGEVTIMPAESDKDAAAADLESLFAVIRSFNNDNEQQTEQETK
jgi:hypothetical protein